MLRIFMMVSIVATLHASSFEAYVDRLKNDPSVQKLLYRSEHYQAEAEASQKLPDPKLILAIDNLPVEEPAFDRYLPTSKTVGIAQAFPKGRAEHADTGIYLAEQSRLEAAYRHAELVAMFVAALSERHAVETLHGFALQQQELLEQARGEALARLESSRADYAELSRIDARLITVDEKLSRLTARQQVAEHALMRLVGEVPDIPVPDIALKAWEIEQVYPVQIAMLQNRAAVSRKEAADALNGPDITMQLLYKQREAGTNFSGEDWVSFGATVTLPVWGGKEARYRAALKDEAVSRASLELEKRRWLQTLEDLESRYVETRERIALHRSHLTVSQESIAALTRTYEAGESPYARVIEAQVLELDIHMLIAELENKAVRLAAAYHSHIEE